MKVIGVVEVDLQCNARGLVSRCLKPWGDGTVLGAAVTRLGASEAIDDVVVSVSADDRAAVAHALLGPPCRIETREHDDIGQRAVLRRARKWSAEGWRGGIGGMTYFDELGTMAELARLADLHHADVVMTARPEAALLDTQLVDQLVRYLDEQGDNVHFAFTTAPPGLAAEAYRAGVLHEFAAAGQSPGFTLRYTPASPQPDQIDGPCCMKIPVATASSPFRYLADSARGLDRLRGLCAIVNGTAGADDVTQVMGEHPELWPGPAPREVEIEITTECNLDDRLRVPRDRVPCRGPMSVGLFTGIVQDLTRGGDDVLVTLGGFGQPLRHPDVVEMIRVAHESGIYGVALVTDGIDLTGPLAEALVQSEVDCILVQLDAHRPETYKHLKGQDRYQEVAAHIEEFVALRRQHKRPYPFIIPQFTKVREAMPEMGDFFDHWLTHADWAVLCGHDARAGQIPSLAVMNMAPAQRTFCRRLFSRMTILSDGTVVGCESDFAGTAVLGHVAHESVVTLWRDGAMSALRSDHLAGRWDRRALCTTCGEWHRP